MPESQMPFPLDYGKKKLASVFEVYINQQLRGFSSMFPRRVTLHNSKQVEAGAFYLRSLSGDAARLRLAPQIQQAGAAITPLKLLRANSRVSQTSDATAPTSVDPRTGPFATPTVTVVQRLVISSMQDVVEFDRDVLKEGKRVKSLRTKAGFDPGTLDGMCYGASRLSHFLCHFADLILVKDPESCAVVIDQATGNPFLKVPINTDDPNNMFLKLIKLLVKYISVFTYDRGLKRFHEKIHSIPAQFYLNSGVYSGLSSPSETMRDQAVNVLYNFLFTLVNQFDILQDGVIIGFLAAIHDVFTNKLSYAGKEFKDEIREIEKWCQEKGLYGTMDQTAIQSNATAVTTVAAGGPGLPDDSHIAYDDELKAQDVDVVSDNVTDDDQNERQEAVERLGVEEDLAEKSGGADYAISETPRPADLYPARAPTPKVGP